MLPNREKERASEARTETLVQTELQSQFLPESFLIFKLNQNKKILLELYLNWIAIKIGCQISAGEIYTTIEILKILSENPLKS